MTWSWIPNAITLGRVLASLPLFWLLIHEYYSAALWLAIAAGLSDALDGVLAKGMGWESTLGGVLDPIADKMLLTACYLGMWKAPLPTWLVAVVIGRDIVILIGAAVWWRIVGAFRPEPSGISKATTATQLVLAALVLSHLAGHEFGKQWVPGLALATAALTVVSGLDYVLSYGVRAWRHLGKGE